MEAVLNALVLIGNYIFVPGLAYGSQLALGALGVTMILPAQLKKFIIYFRFCAENGPSLPVSYLAAKDSRSRWDGP